MWQPAILLPCINPEANITSNTFELLTSARSCTSKESGTDTTLLCFFLFPPFFLFFLLICRSTLPALHPWKDMHYIILSLARIAIVYPYKVICLSIQASLVNCLVFLYNLILLFLKIIKERYYENENSMYYRTIKRIRGNA